jgi:hypothetical protein
MRTFTRAASGHGSAANASCAATAPATAPDESRKAAKSSSPLRSTMLPPLVAIADQRPMAFEHLGVQIAELAQEPGRALDVGEQKGAVGGHRYCRSSPGHVSERR